MPSGVKVDVQNQLELVGSAAGQQGGQPLAQAWHSALEDSVAAHFQGNLINCMCHNTSVSEACSSLDAWKPHQVMVRAAKG
jgi:hypothetical protein